MSTATDFRLSYTARDFDTIRVELEAFIQQTRPTEWSDFFESNLGKSLIQMNALVGDMVSYVQDATAIEMYLASCLRYESALRFCRSVGYVPSSAEAAEVLLTSTSLPAAIVTNGGTIAAGTKITVGGVTYELLETATIPVAATTSRLSMFEGESYEETFDPTSKASQTILSANGIVEDDSWSVYVGDTAIAANLWTQVDRVSLETTPTKKYSISFDAEGRLQILFGDGAAGKVPDDTITLQYRTCTGTSGNAPINSIQTSIKANIAGGLGTASISYLNSEGAASGGRNRESLAEIKVNVPAYIRSQDKVLSVLDYNTSVLKAAGVVLVYADALIASYGFNVTQVHVWEEESVTFTGETYDAAVSTEATYDRYAQMPLARANNVQEYLRTRTPLNILSAILRPTIASLDIYLGDVYFNSVYEASYVHEKVTEAIIEVMEGCGFSVRLSDLYDAIRDAAGVEHFYIDRIVFSHYAKEVAAGTVVLSGQPSDADWVKLSDGTTRTPKVVVGTPSKDNGTTTFEVTVPGMTTDEHAGRLCVFQPSGNGYVVVSNTSSHVTVTGDASGEGVDRDVSLIVTKTFEFDDGGGVSAPNIEVPIGASIAITLENLRYAINTNLEISGLTDSDAVNPTIDLTNNATGTAGNVAAVKSGANIAVTGMTGGTDTPALRVEDYRRIQDPGDADRWPAGAYDPGPPWQDGGQTPYRAMADISIGAAVGVRQYYDESRQYNNEIYYNAGVLGSTLVEAINLRRLIMALVPSS